MKTKSKKRYTRSGLLSLFLAVAFPVHLWTLILVLADIGWLTERTNLWDALGNAAYALIFCLLESAALFLLLILLGLLLPSMWKQEKRIAFLSVLFYIITFFAILGQLYFIFEWAPGKTFVHLLAGSGRPLIYLYLVVLAAICAVLLPAVFWLVRSERAAKIVMNVLDRLAVLTVLYLSFDFFALILVILRNI